MTRTEATRLEEIVGRLEALGDAEAVAGMARFGIVGNKVYGVKVPELRKMGKEIGPNHKLARELWEFGARETRILAALTGEPSQVTGELMESWVRDLDSWEVCDQLCINLFRHVDGIEKKAVEWAGREEEFVKRCGFAVMAVLAAWDRTAGDELFEGFIPIIEREAWDGRNYVKKAVSWALRHIGKRNQRLHRPAVEAAVRIENQGTKAARWIARDVLRELTSAKIRDRLGLTD